MNRPGPHPLKALRAAFLRSDGGATAAEFALVLPLALIFLLGIIDVGRFAWSLNEVEKAVQIGARHAVVTNPVVSGINEADFKDSCGDPLAIGARICADAFPPIVCGATQCQCEGGSCGAVDENTHNADAFNGIVTRMRTIAPYIADANVTVTYSPSGIGYYGDPLCYGTRKNSGCDTGEVSDVAPIVTVRVNSVPFRPLTFALLDAGINMPNSSYSLTYEDGVGTQAY